MVISTFFSDSKLSTQIGSLGLMIPLAIYIGLSRSNANYLYIFFWLPHFPTIAILAECAYVNTGISMPVAWICLILTIPLYYGLYVYLDQVIPDTYGISKKCCFCLRRKRITTANANDDYSTLNEVQDDETQTVSYNPHQINNGGSEIERVPLNS